MKPKAYILVAHDGMAYSVNGAAAAKGFEYMGYEICPFRYSELESLELAPDTPVIGGMGTVKTALARLGVEPTMSVFQRASTHLPGDACGVPP